MSRRRPPVRPLAGRHAHRRPAGRGGGPVALALSVCLLAVLGMGTVVAAAFLRHPERQLKQNVVAAPQVTTLPLVGAEETPSPSPTSPAPTPSAGTPSPSTVALGRAVIASDRRRSVELRSVRASGSPKSLAVSPSGQVAVLSMSSADIVVYDPSGRVRAKVSSKVTPSAFGLGQWSQRLTGAPVDGAFSPDGKHLWVSNYAMSGSGFTHPGDDECRSGAGLDHSFLFRVSTATWKVDAVVPVGAVPKDVRVTPDGARVLVSNWCSGELSVVDAASAKVTREVALGSHPRGIAVTADSATAYVALTGGEDVAVVDLGATGATGTDSPDGVRLLRGIGAGPRQVVLTPDGRRLFVTCLTAGRVVEVDAASGNVLGSVATGKEPRTAAVSGDGSALFVVNYESSTVTRVRTSDLKVMESLRVPRHTIALAYLPTVAQLWVGEVDGTLRVFGDQAEN